MKVPDKAQIVQWVCARCSKRQKSFVLLGASLVCKFCKATAPAEGEGWGPMEGGNAK